MNAKKIWKWFSNGLLVLVVLILLIPSWRIRFQSWFGSLFMGETYFYTMYETDLPGALGQWSLQPIDGETIHFSTLQDKPIVLSFWATWCPSCRTELRELTEIEAAFHNNINFIAVTEEQQQHVMKSGLDKKHPFLYTTDAYPHFFDIKVYPTLCIIDRKGRLLYKQEGAGALNSEKNHAFLNDLVENR